MFFYKTARDKQPLFYADNRKIVIEGNTYYNSDIVELKVNCILGRFFPVRKHLDKIEELVSYPPLHRLSGSVEINTVNGVFTYPKVYCVMEAYMFFKRIYKGTQASYTYRDTTLPYRYESKLSESFFSQKRSYASAFILNNDKRMDRQAIMEMKDSWTEQCGFRPCRPEENCCFNEIILFSEDDRWITSYDDSLEGLSAIGIINQCDIYSEEAAGHHVLIIAVYENAAMLLAHGYNKKIDLFFCGDKAYAEPLHCHDAEFSAEYSVLEEICVNDGEMSVREIFENENMDMSERLLVLAERLDINDYFIRSGFYDLHALTYYEIGEFINGYETENYRIRLDEEKIPGIYDVMSQGSSAIDIVNKDERLEAGKPYTITALNIGSASEGFTLCLHSDEIHEIILSGMRSGNIPIRLKNCHFTNIKDEFDTEEIQPSAVSMTDYAKGIDAEENTIYENIPFEMVYKFHFGQYSFVYEDRRLVVPTGVVFNNKNIKTQKDKEKADWLLQRASINITFTLESDVPLNEPVEIMLIPQGNVYGGIGIINTKVYRR